MKDAEHQNRSLRTVNRFSKFLQEVAIVRVTTFKILPEFVDHNTNAAFRILLCFFHNRVDSFTSIFGSRTNSLNKIRRQMTVVTDHRHDAIRLLRRESLTNRFRLLRIGVQNSLRRLAQLNISTEETTKEQSQSRLTTTVRTRPRERTLIGFLQIMSHHRQAFFIRILKNESFKRISLRDVRIELD